MKNRSTYFLLFTCGILMSYLSFGQNTFYISKENIPSSSFKSWFNRHFNVDDRLKLSMIKSEVDDLGLEHQTYQQYYKNTPIQNAIVKAHFKHGKLHLINGNYHKNITEKGHLLDPVRAVRAAKKESKAKVFRDEVDSNFSITPSHVFLHLGNNILVLALRVDVYSLAPLSYKSYYVSGNNYNIIKIEDRIHSIDAEGSAVTKYYGNRQITTDSLSSNLYRLSESSRSGITTLNMQNSYFNSVDFHDSDNHWNNVNSNQDEAATDAHWSSEMFYDYLSNKHSRNSYDGLGASLTTKIHYGHQYNNAFWDGSHVFIGDGDGINYGPLTTLDVIAHEYTHGLIESTANFVFSNESGALSESFADIFGTAVEFYATPSTANYLMKEKASLTGGAERSLASPKSYDDPDTYLGINWKSGAADNGGVHSNCGVQNYWFYLLANGGAGINDFGTNYNIDGIGMNDAMRIIYRALTVYHTPTSKYADARLYAIQAAEDLFGSCSQQVISATNAWNAVGIGNSYQNSLPQAGFHVDKTYSCYTPETVHFIDTSKNSGTVQWFFGDGDSSLLPNPSHIYDSSGIYSVMQIVSGIGCSLQDTFFIENYIVIDSVRGPRPSSCTPATTNYCCGRGISRVHFGSIDHFTGDGAEGYQDYSCSQSTNMTVGDNYIIEIETGLGVHENVKVWIDYNDNGVFNDVDELIFHSENKHIYHSGIITIDSSAVLNTSLRMRVASDIASNTLYSCSTTEYGQVEDYAITLSAPQGPPSVNFTSTSTNIIVGSSINFNDLSANGVNSWHWTFEGGTPSYSFEENPPNITYDTAGFYSVKLVVSNSSGSDSTLNMGYISVVDEVTMCSQTEVNSPIGTFYDPGGDSLSYSNSSNCSLLIQPECATDISISFSFLDLADTSDVIKIYDGESDQAPLLQVVRTGDIPDTIVSSSGSLFIVFESDSFDTGLGWIGSWISTVPVSSPIASFSISDTNIAVGVPVSVVNQSIGIQENWTWNFSNGYSSTEESVQYLFQSPGLYSIQLVTNNCLGSDSIFQSLQVQDYPQLLYEDSQLNLHSSSCDDTLFAMLSLFNVSGGNLVWNTINPSDSGIISAGDSSSITFPFPVEGLSSGTYTDTITLYSNDTAFLELKIPVVITLSNIEPNILFVDSCLFIDSLFYEDISAKNFTIYNTGCEALSIENITSNNVFFDVYTDSATIPGHDSIVIPTSFTPNLPGMAMAEISVQTDIADTSFCAYGYGFPTPKILISENTVEVTLGGCSTASQTLLSIKNEGNSFLSGHMVSSNNSSWLSFSSSILDSIIPSGSDSLLVLVDASSLPNGVYTDTLLITSNDPFSSTMHIPIRLSVSHVPCASYFTNYTICNDSISFMDNSSNYPISWVWDFGDGNTSTLQNPTHTYSDTGNYVVSMIATNSSGQSEEIRSTVDIRFIQASFVSSGNFTTYNPVNFMNTSIGGTSFLWSFGDGVNSSNVNETNIYTVPSVYQVTLTVSDDYNCEMESVQMVEILPTTSQDSIPISGFDFLKKDSCNVLVEFVDTTENIPSSWFWDFGDGNISYDQNPVHSFPLSGEYLVKLVTTNQYGQDSSFKSVVIDLPTVDFEIKGNLVPFDSISFIPLDSSLIQQSWDFGDGDSSLLNNPSHVYNDTGTYQIVLKALDMAGCSTQTSRIITISNSTGITSLSPAIGFKIYPNPNNGLFFMHTDQPAFYKTVDVFDLLGKEIMIKDIIENKTYFDLSNFGSGVYFVQINSFDSKYIQKVVVR